MSAHERLAIFPSRANHVLMRYRIVVAAKGLQLLKRKRDALELRLREIRTQLRQEEHLLYKVMHEAIFSMAKARYLRTDFKPAAIMGVDRADVYLRVRSVKVVGVMLPTFFLVMKPSGSFPLTGLSAGGRQVDAVREKFREVLRVLVSLASLKYSVKVLNEAVRQNNTRVNGLEYVLIPRFQNTVEYIRDELDEYEREDFYRLKRSQAKQRKAKEKFKQDIEMRRKNALIPLPEVVDVPFDMDEFNNENETMLPGEGEEQAIEAGEGALEENEGDNKEQETAESAEEAPTEPPTEPAPETEQPPEN